MIIRKATKKANCPYIRPSRELKDGRMVQVKRCIAFTPSLLLDDERTICKGCTVLDYLTKEGVCKFLTPLDLKGKNGSTRWLCKKTNKKYINPDRCTPRFCGLYKKKVV